jgi:transcription-repair coupling factor (superfamily II helicase)
MKNFKTQKIILINECINKIVIDEINEHITAERIKLSKAEINEQDQIISQIEKYKKEYFKAKEYAGYFHEFDKFLEHSKLSLNIIFDYLYKDQYCIRLNDKGVDMLINFCYELMSFDEKDDKCKNKKSSHQHKFKNIYDWTKSLEMRLKFYEIEQPENDDDDDEMGWMSDEPDKENVYQALIDFLIDVKNTNTELIWSWQ